MAFPMKGAAPKGNPFGKKAGAKKPKKRPPPMEPAMAGGGPPSPPPMSTGLTRKQPMGKDY